MKQLTQQWDAALGNTKGKLSISRVLFPSSISKTLIEREYDRVTITITEAGLLLKPYKSTHPEGMEKHKPVTLPDW